MSVYTIILVWLFWICYIMESLFICRDLRILYDDVRWFYDMYIFGDLCYISTATVDEFYTYMLFEIYWRRNVYFLNICIIRVFYRFNRSRALQITLLFSLMLKYTFPSPLIKNILENISLLTPKRSLNYISLPSYVKITLYSLNNFLAFLIIMQK